MAMSLSDIEERAQDLIVQLLSAGKNEALLIGIQIEGLRDLAQIKAVGMEAQAWGTTEPDPRNVSGLCFAISPLAIGKPPYPCCELMRGHAGEHSDGTTNWTNAAEKTEPVAPGAAPCPSTLSMGKDEYYVCTIPAPHEGLHSGGGKWWSGPGNGQQTTVAAISAAFVNQPDGKEDEPTKPAADQLHELLSYLRTHAEEADDKAGHVSAQSPPWTRHKAVYRAYDDAATKLRDILSEGGI